MVESTDDDRWAALATDLGVNESEPVSHTPPPLPGAPPKRRRRRRSRKGLAGEGIMSEPNGDSQDEPTEERDAPTGDEPVGEDGLKKRRRRRSRRVKDEVNGEAGTSSEAVAVAEVDDDLDYAAEPVSVAGLPSWQELIDGLHRP